MLKEVVFSVVLNEHVEETVVPELSINHLSQCCSSVAGSQSGIKTTKVGYPDSGWNWDMF